MGQRLQKRMSLSGQLVRFAAAFFSVIETWQARAKRRKYNR
jgi:hypothetical protein